MQWTPIHMVFGGENNGIDDGSYLLFHNGTHHKTNPTIIVQLNGHIHYS